MTENIVALDVNGAKVILDSNTKLFRLKATGAGAAISCVNLSTGQDYQVPVGRKANIVYIFTANTVNPTEAIIYADNQNGTTNSVNLFLSLTTVTDTIFVSADVPATKWINFNNAVGTRVVDFYIIEQSA